MPKREVLFCVYCGYNDNSRNIIRQEESRVSEMKAQRASKLQKGNSVLLNGYIVGMFIMVMLLALFYIWFFLNAYSIILSSPAPSAEEKQLTSNEIKVSRL